MWCCESWIGRIKPLDSGTDSNMNLPHRRTQRDTIRYTTVHTMCVHILNVAYVYAAAAYDHVHCGEYYCCCQMMCWFGCCGWCTILCSYHSLCFLSVPLFSFFPFALFFFSPYSRVQNVSINGSMITINQRQQSTHLIVHTHFYYFCLFLGGSRCVVTGLFLLKVAGTQE